jgi:hypothetical protein
MLSPEQVRDILAEHQARLARGPVPSRRLTTADLRLQTPNKSVSFDDEDDRNKRVAGVPKPWQLAYYRGSPHSYALFAAGKRHFKQKLMLENAWPLGEERARSGRQAWDLAVKDHPDLYAAGELLNHCLSD